MARLGVGSAVVPVRDREAPGRVIRAYRGLLKALEEGRPSGLLILEGYLAASGKSTRIPTKTAVQPCDGVKINDMIEIQASDPIGFSMRSRSPSVYLDHGPFMDLAGGPEASRRFVQTLKAKGGTLCFSRISLFEFTKVGLRETRESAEALLQDCVPNIAILKNFPEKVIRDEDVQVRRPAAERQSVHLDFEALRSFALEARQASQLEPWGFCGLFEDVAGEPELVAAFESLKKSVASRIAAAKTRQGRIRGEPDWSAALPPTRLLDHRLLAAQIKDKVAPFEGNDSVDYFHSVVPTAFCDFVVLDRKWGSQVTQAIAGLPQEAMEKCARVFFGKGWQDELLDRLKSFPSASPRPW